TIYPSFANRAVPAFPGWDRLKRQARPSPPRNSLHGLGGVRTMYSVVLMAALTTGTASEGCCFRHGGCYGGCYGGYNGCYGGVYAGCYGGSYYNAGCYGGSYGCYGVYGCYGCYGGWSCYGGGYGCYGGY